jgi:Fe-Mn family superoxide dismutase
MNSINKNILRAEYENRILESLAKSYLMITETEVFDTDGRLLLSPGLKVRDIKSGLEYTVDRVIGSDKEAKVILNSPETPRVKPGAKPSQTNLGKNPGKPAGDLGFSSKPEISPEEEMLNKPGKIEIPVADFKKNFRAGSASADPEGPEGSAAVSKKKSPIVNVEAAVKAISESYVVQAKKFNLNTESCSKSVLATHEELFKEYTESLNKVSASLDGADRENANSNCSEFRSLKIDESFLINASFLHALYFENIGDLQSKITVDSLAYMRLQRDFGTFDEWQKDFVACAMAARNGWVLTVYNVFLKRYMNVMVDSHNFNIPIGCIPVIAIDVWEHSYFKDFLKNKKEYVYKTMKELNWSAIETRIDRCDKIQKLYGGINAA